MRRYAADARRKKAGDFRPGPVSVRAKICSGHAPQKAGFLDTQACLEQRLRHRQRESLPDRPGCREDLARTPERSLAPVRAGSHPGHMGSRRCFQCCHMWAVNQAARGVAGPAGPVKPHYCQQTLERHIAQRRQLWVRARSASATSWRCSRRQQQQVSMAGCTP